MATSALDGATSATAESRSPIGSGSPAVPSDSGLAPVIAGTRRTMATATSATANSSPLLFGANPITVAPTVQWNAGVFTGNANATDASGNPLTYSMVGAPSLGGKLGNGPVLPLVAFDDNGDFTYLPTGAALTDPAAHETFTIRVSELTPFDQALENLLGEAGPLVPLAVSVIHDIPIVGTVLSPIIGASRVVTFTVNPNTLAAGRPTAFTYMMPSFDDTLISLNFFPAVNVATGAAVSAPTILAASGLATKSNSDPTTVFGQMDLWSEQLGSATPGIAPLRSDSFTNPVTGATYSGGGGYNVVTWDPRGEYASGGQLEIDNPMFEGRDVSSIISWLSSADNPARLQVAMDPNAPANPLVGMTGGSYGGGIQLTTVDPRIKALVPEIGWNSLLSSLYPNSNQFKTGFGTIMAAALALTGARVNPTIYAGVITGLLTGYLTQSQQALMGSVGPTALLSQLRTPTLLFQGMQDLLFTLQQATDTAQALLANPYSPPVKLVWFCGGHGTCDSMTPAQMHAQDDQGIIDNLKWLDQYVAGNGAAAATIPNFQWYDQQGNYFASQLFPFQAGFASANPVSVTGSGGLLGIVPVIGGSGPGLTALPFSLPNPAKAWNALNSTATIPVGAQVVGAPVLSFDYTGLGTGRTVYAQLVDGSTGDVVGHMVTPIPVTLDGQHHTVTIPMESIAFTSYANDDSMTLQITSSAINYENFYSLGLVDISNVKLTLPVRA